MDTKLVKILNVIGDFVIVNVNGEKFKAKVEGRVPSDLFLGKITKEKDKIVIKVVDDIISKDLGRILEQVNVPKSPKNYLLTKILMTFNIPITSEIYELFNEFNLPFLISSIILKGNDSIKSTRKQLILAEVLYEELGKKFDDTEFSLFVSCFISDYSKIYIFTDSENRRWFSYFELEEDIVRKFILSTTIDNVDVLVVFERMLNRYNVVINLFTDKRIHIEDVDVLKSKLESIGFKPMNIDIEIFGGS
ncbi:MAG: hypothetical protein N2712_03535 [Brevinematales bacterium]|nr:hypothetical protein [Brevinematales bacterium]